MSEPDFNWKPCDEKTTNALLSGSNAPGKLWKFEPQYLPQSIATGMRGVAEFYVSGAVNLASTADGKTLQGEFAAVRYENGEAIPYRWLFAASDEEDERKVYFGGFYKKCDERHKESGSLDVGEMFRKPNPKWPKP